MFFRTDESGTTENFQKYLAGAGGGAWTDEPSKVWPGAGEGRREVLGRRRRREDHPELDHLRRVVLRQGQRLGMAQVDNGAGAGRADRRVGRQGGRRRPSRWAPATTCASSSTTPPRPTGAYPIVLVTYEIACSKGLPADKAKLVKSFLTYFAAADTQASLEEIGYAPLPDEVRTKVETADQGARLTTTTATDVLPGADGTAGQDVRSSDRSADREPSR